MNYKSKTISHRCIEDPPSVACDRSLINAVLLVLASLSIIFLLTSCSNLMTPTFASEEGVYLTPLLAETLAAYQEGTPITSKLQAVIAARAYLGTTRFRSTLEPKVISIVEDYPNIWKIVFEGEWLINPPDPDHTFTPLPPEHGCVYVIIDATGQVSTEIGTSACAP